MKRYMTYAVALVALIASQSILTACEDIDEVPPMKDSSTGKSYKIPDPVIMDAADVAAYEEIRDEYNRSTTLL